MLKDPSLAWRLAEIARELATQSSRQLTLQRVVDRAVETIPGCEFAGVSVRRGRGVVETPAATDPLVEVVDSLQYQLGEGPCLSAIWVDETYVISDMTTEARWPRWATQASRLGIRSVLSVRLATPADVIGGLNLYSSQLNSYTENSIDVAHMYALHAATALEVSSEVDGLRSALQSRHTIGIAQGILMKRYNLDVDGSFALLKRLSQDENRKLRDVAAQIVSNVRTV